MRVASIDIGTNTIRLLIADCDSSGGLKFLAQRRAVVRLGEGLSATGRLKKEAIKRAISVLSEFLKVCSELRVERIIAFATSAVREAENGYEFVELARRELNLEVKVISGKEEAYYTYLGVKEGLGLSGEFLVFDIGGGSTEYICCGSDLKMKSLDLGVVKLTESLISHDPPLESELNALKDFVRMRLSELDMNECRGRTVVGTAGTPTTIAAIDLGLEVYDPEKVHGHKISLERIKEIYEFLRKMPSAERLKVKGMEKGREDLIIAGLIITLETLKFFGARELTVSEWGIREGVIIHERKASGKNC